MYELVLCIGITWAGCGTWDIIKLPNKESCFENLDHVKIGSSGSQGQTKALAYCRPQQRLNIEQSSPTSRHFP